MTSLSDLVLVSSCSFIGSEVVVVLSSGYAEEGVVTSGLVVVVVVVVSNVVVVLELDDVVVVRGGVVDLDLVVGLVGDEVGVVVRVVVVSVDAVVVDVVKPDLGSKVVVVTSFDPLDSELIVPGGDECVMVSGVVLLYVEVDLVVVVVVKVVEVGALDGEVVMGGVSFISRASISWRSTKRCNLHTCISSMLSKRSS